MRGPYSGGNFEFNVSIPPMYPFYGLWNVVVSCELSLHWHDVQSQTFSSTESSMLDQGLSSEHLHEHGTRVYRYIGQRLETSAYCQRGASWLAGFFSCSFLCEKRIPILKSLKTKRVSVWTYACVFCFIRQLIFLEPNPNFPVNPECCEVYKHDPALFRKLVSIIPSPSPDDVSC